MADTIQSVKDLPDVSFVDNDTLEEMRIRMVSNFEAEYERLTGQKITLSAADPNRIMLYAMSLGLYQVEQYVDRAGKQDLLKYSYGDFLDNLAGNRGVLRVQPTPAKTTMRFTLSEAKDYPIGIPEGTMVTNGDVYFTTDEYTEIAIGTLFVDINATCTTNGVAGNDLLAGQIKTLVDSIPYIKSVSNLTTSSGGCDLESDENLAERVFLAPASYSVAGPDDAYIYWVKTFSSSIGDIAISSPSPVEVEIRVLMSNGDMPTATILSEIGAFLEENKVRPLTDKVTIKAPTSIPFNISMTYYINRADQSKAGIIQSEVATAIAEYLKWQTCTIGRDINPSELTKRVMEAGAKRVEVVSPVFTKIPSTSVARIGTQTVTYGGVE